MTIRQLGGYPLTVLTAVTAQNHEECSYVEFLSRKIVTQQILSLLALYPIKAVKIGVLGSDVTIRHLAPFLTPLAKARIPIILDPVISASTGYCFQNDKAQHALMTTFFPILHCITPNIYEAQCLTRSTIANTHDAIESASILRAQGVKNVIITGGDGNNHRGTGNDIEDVLLCEGRDEPIISRHARMRSTPFYHHGTGCCFASALSFFVANGHDMLSSYQRARDVVIAHLRKTDTDTGIGGLA